MRKIIRSAVLLVLVSLLVPTAQAAGIVFTFGSNITAERRAALEAAATEIQQIIHFRQDIKVAVSFTNLACDNAGAVLGFAGPDNVHMNFAGAPQADLWYVSALAADEGHPAALDDASHITAEFNHQLGTTCPAFEWYFGTDHQPGPGQIDFLATAVHEFMHGLGFLSFNGQDGRNIDGSGVANAGHLDAFSALLMDNTTGKRWPAMTDAERAASMLKNGNLVWDGSKATAMDSLLDTGLTNGRIRMFAPTKYQDGSSTSHFDTELFYLSQEHEVMEPEDASPQSSVLASAALCDIGWQLSRDTDGDGINDCEDSMPLQAEVDTDGDGVVDSLDAFPDNPAEWLDTDGDGIGDNADVDNDNDGIADATDNCPDVSNPAQLDYDNDGIGNACGDPLPLPDFTGALKKDAVGSAVAYAGDIDKDGYGDYVVGIPLHDVNGERVLKNAGQVLVISGRTAAVLFAREGAAANDRLGTAVAGAAYVDGDTYLDVVVGAPGADDVAHGVRDSGSVTVLFGPDGTRSRTFFGTDVGVRAGALFGAAVAVGDIDNNNLADLVVGAPKDRDADSGLKGAGSVTVIAAADSSVMARYAGTTAGAAAGTAVAVADVSGDSVPDVIVGAPKQGGVGSVTVYNMAGEVMPAQSGAVKGSLFGMAVAGGLVDGDPCADVVVGAPGDDDFGRMFKDTGSVTVLKGCTAGDTLFNWFGDRPGARAGSAVAAGDINGDHFADIIAGALKDDNPDARRVRDTGSASIHDGRTGSNVTTLYGASTGDYFGSALAAGDLDGDGKADVLVGASGDDQAARDAGSVQLFSGSGL